MLWYPLSKIDELPLTCHCIANYNIMSKRINIKCLNYLQNIMALQQNGQWLCCFVTSCNSEFGNIRVLNCMTWPVGVLAAPATCSTLNHFYLHRIEWSLFGLECVQQSVGQPLVAISKIDASSIKHYSAWQFRWHSLLPEMHGQTNCAGYNSVPEKTATNFYLEQKIHVKIETCDR